MSALRAINLPTQRIDPVPAAATAAYGHVTAGPDVPQWALLVEEAIRVTARLGFSPTPTILISFATVLGISLTRS